jgi:hypothetical protein
MLTDNQHTRHVVTFFLWVAWEGKFVWSMNREFDWVFLLFLTWNYLFIALISWNVDFPWICFKTLSKLNFKLILTHSDEYLFSVQDVCKLLFGSRSIVMCLWLSIGWYGRPFQMSFLFVSCSIFCELWMFNMFVKILVG